MLVRTSAFLVHHAIFLHKKMLHSAEALSSPALVLCESVSSRPAQCERADCSVSANLFSTLRHLTPYNFRGGPFFSVPWWLYGIFVGGSYASWALAYVIITLHWCHAATKPALQLIHERKTPYVRTIMAALGIAIGSVALLSATRGYKAFFRIRLWTTVGIGVALTIASLVVLRRVIISERRASMHLTTAQRCAMLKQTEAAREAAGGRGARSGRRASPPVGVLSSLGRPATGDATNGGQETSTGSSSRMHWIAAWHDGRNSIRTRMTKGEVAPFKMIRLALLLLGWSIYSFYQRVREPILNDMGDIHRFLIVEAILGVLWSYNLSLVQRIAFTGLRARWRRGNPNRKLPALLREIRILSFSSLRPARVSRPSFRSSTDSQPSETHSERSRPTETPPLAKKDMEKEGEAPEDDEAKIPPDASVSSFRGRLDPFETSSPSPRDGSLIPGDILIHCLASSDDLDVLSPNLACVDDQLASTEEEGGEQTASAEKNDDDDRGHPGRGEDVGADGDGASGGEGDAAETGCGLSGLVHGGSAA